MARYGVRALSQVGAAQLQGLPATTTVNGDMGGLLASATAGFRLHRVGFGCTFTGAITSVQIQVAIYNQTVAPVGTLAAAIKGQAFEIWTPVDPTAGFIGNTGLTWATNGPTITTSTGPLKTLSFNSQTWGETAWELNEEIVCNLGAANGLRFIIVSAGGSTLPSGCQVALDLDYEV